MQYYFSLDGVQRQGPVPLEALRDRGVGPETMVWREGLIDWMPAKDVPELQGLFSSQVAWQESQRPAQASPPPSHQASQPPQMPPRPSVTVPYQVPTANQTNTNGMAVTSLVVGIGGLVIMPCLAMIPCVGLLAVVPPILAVVFGHIARGQIQRGQGNGAGVALAGLIIGYAAIGLTAVLVTLVVALSFMSPNRTINFTPPTPSPPAVPATVPPDRRR